jgi:hypothetical protein
MPSFRTYAEAYQIIKNYESARLRSKGQHMPDAQMHNLVCHLIDDAREDLIQAGKKVPTWVEIVNRCISGRG